MNDGIIDYRRLEQFLAAYQHDVPRSFVSTKGPRLGTRNPIMLRAHLQLAHPGVVGLSHQLDGKISLPS
jgi:hypothetical protein